MFEEKIPLSKIHVLENIRTRIEQQDLTELMESIKQHGLLQPIGVWKEDNGEYTLAFGHRRFEAMKKLGWTHVVVGTQVIVLPEKLSLDEFLVLNTTENIIREGISPVELGKICSRLIEMNYSLGEIASRLSIPKKRVESAINIFTNTPEEYKAHIGYIPSGSGRKKTKISASVANSIINLRVSKETKERLFDEAKKRDLSGEEINVIALLLDSGATVSEALDKVKQFIRRSINMPIKKAELQKLAQSNYYYYGSFTNLIRAIVAGKVPPMPDIIYDIKKKEKGRKVEED
jgi:ParB/RepB/Spo0J family partition protein